MIELVLGGVRSGKSRYAESVVKRFPAPWIYLATGRAWDDEMQERIVRHQADRGEGWLTVEEPLELVDALVAAGDVPVLVDCLTLWLTNLLMAERDISIEKQRLLIALSRRKALTVLVGNEVGLGIVPENALARRFRDEAGWLHQAVAAQAEKVVLCVAGIPCVIKEVSGPATD
ncbi:bifunctional adenosylcobinamide kinase/adenosylcobinamide-phosphate guanylyltransferase [Acetobacter sp.]|jgi:adenosylcobinamide kinase/adenosylcobinamide-phosphate guanylyltransferase|uniref:bifunctional adenosylcobinamide kinase/adenosylcobinamide-phosphate guanylyltransferase n=1 Tax=Acetobacter sp. TaxID=440 RepID=UPI0025C30114|nr:bifunctional adenosylcobinamide kinase/adenosylcobinamide-phosphate guanylyltransferase [Acetobacter sp.]MCH4089727.1 bifunctional adenosylcobinamide kinase/adenosylcobinamide-phosphate guanylyltransferase [Acetobacter sp.]MCI1298423.1 bifunctional adenosylcobinamide kinase/adenosylcobinamide-phosphate guanylyltransferase [Acetobacter sp.]MCI1316378.1 bifunctional adenosylcobinamide kinase/adenosylcobinamide-phosphate guanylyltransferase [Acetobacter sp.]